MLLTQVCVFAALTLSPAQVLEDEELSLDEKTAALGIGNPEEWAFLFEEEGELDEENEEEE